jgi:hypothetical protein
VNPVAGYVVSEEFVNGDVAVVSGLFATDEGALHWAKHLAQQDKRDYYVCKLVPTHFIKHPTIPEPEVKEVKGVLDVAVAP